MRETSASEPLSKHRNALGGIKTGASLLLREKYGGNLLTGHAVSGVKREPVSDIDTAVVDSLKVLDLKWPIREADIKEFGSPKKNPRDIARGFAISELALFYCGPNR